MTKSKKTKPNLLQSMARKAIREMIFQINGNVPEKTISEPVKGTELWYRDRLAKQLNGQVEVSTPAGRIDILTDTEVIEIKRASGWKSAIGQIISYGKFYPHHRQRIHLFGKLTESKLKAIEDICEAQNICLTWE